METTSDFVDHHAHFLAKSAGEVWLADSLSSYRTLAHQGLSPLDIPHEYVEGSLIGVFENSFTSAAESGLRQVTEAGMCNWEYWDALKTLREQDRLPLRVRILVASGAADLKRMQRTGDSQLEIEGVKFYADGSVGDRTCALSDPFTDDPANSGIAFFDATTLARRAQPFAEAGFRIATHAIGDRAIEIVLDAYEKVFGSDYAAAAPRIEHAQVLRPDLIDRITQLGVVCCIQPSFATSDAEFAEKRLGADRMLHSYNWQALADAGVKLIAGSDYPIETFNPQVGLRRLTTGQDDAGNVVAKPLDHDVAMAAMTASENFS